MKKIIIAWVLFMLACLFLKPYGVKDADLEFEPGPDYGDKKIDTLIIKPRDTTQYKGNWVDPT